MNQAEDRLSGLEDKVEIPNKECEKFNKTQERNTEGMWDTMIKNKQTNKQILEF